MAYGGKPSTGCQMCRIRRIKCDETKPACKQCAKARRQCPGYRDIGQSSSRDEAQAADRKSEKAPLAPKTARTASASAVDAHYSTDEAIAALLQLPLEDIATCHFLSNYVLIPRQGLTTTRGFLEFVLPLLKAEQVPSHFRHAFDACALASLNNRVGTGNDFDKEALGCYTKALAATFTALKDPVMVKQDATLAAILLLSLFENLTAKSLGMLAWSSHIEGAIQLVKTRGPEQLKTKTGLDLFVAVRVQMIIHSLTTGKAPTLGVDWWVDDPASSAHASDFQRLSSRTGALRNEVNHLLGTVARKPENMERIQEAMRKCRALDRETVEWMDGLPAMFRFMTVDWEDYNPKRDYAKTEAFPGRIDMYHDLLVVNILNTMRCMRIVLASLMIRSTAWLIDPADYRTTPEYAATARTCVEIIADIIASVPYQLGWFWRRKDLRERARLSGFACGNDDSNDKGLSGYFLLWPLACIIVQDYLTDLQRVWVKGRLRCIGNELGVRYGLMLSQLNVRTPSMLILRDRLKNGAHKAAAAMAPGGQSAAAHQPGKPTTDAQEAAYRKTIQRQTEELKKKAVDAAGNMDEWTVKTWLQL